jgi:hypothetical protein
MRVIPTLAALAILASSRLASSTEATYAAEVSFKVLGTGSVPEMHPHEAPLTPTTSTLPTLILVHNEAELRRIWAQFHLQAGRGGPQSAPTVDFDHSVAVLFFGDRGSDCNPYRLARVLSSPDKVTLHVIHQMLGKNCVCASFVFEPYILARIPRTEKPIGFEIETETHACG